MALSYDGFIISGRDGYSHGLYRPNSLLKLLPGCSIRTRVYFFRCPKLIKTIRILMKRVRLGVRAKQNTIPLPYLWATLTSPVRFAPSVARLPQTHRTVKSQNLLTPAAACGGSFLNASPSANWKAAALCDPEVLFHGVGKWSYSEVLRSGDTIRGDLMGKTDCGESSWWGGGVSFSRVNLGLWKKRPLPLRWGTSCTWRGCFIQPAVFQACLPPDTFGVICARPGRAQ